MSEQLSLGEESEEYRLFVDKFKPKKTTDDCYTPDYVYEVVLGYVVERYGIDPDSVVRPFYPGRDYKQADYTGRVVVDNPPFSILSEVKAHYMARGVPFFLFCPTMTAFSGARTCSMTHLVTNADIVYENGATVPTSFVTNMGTDGVVAESCPELGDRINEAIEGRKPEPLPKYEFPEHIVTAARLSYLANHGITYQVTSDSCTYVRTLDDMTAKGKSRIFGGGLLLSEHAAAKHAAAKHAAAKHAAAKHAAAKHAADEANKAIVFELSDRERRIIELLD